jgi:membrane-associated protein
MLTYLQPQYLIGVAGLMGVIAIVFAESGLFFGFFLPGDSLLFTAGLFASQGHIDIFLLVIGCAVAAVAGDSVGYSFGRKVGPAIFSREDSLFFNKRHIERARAFYEKHGPKAIVLARFVPIVRTFAPIVAGVGGMQYKKFASFNIVGGLLWTLLLTLSGYFLGAAFPATERYLNWIVIFIVLISLVPIAIEWSKAKKAGTPSV